MHSKYSILKLQGHNEFFDVFTDIKSSDVGGYILFSCKHYIQMHYESFHEIIVDVFDRLKISAAMMCPLCALNT